MIPQGMRRPLLGGYPLLSLRLLRRLSRYRRLPASLLSGWVVFLPILVRQVRSASNGFCATVPGYHKLSVLTRTHPLLPPLPRWLQYPTSIIGLVSSLAQCRLLTLKKRSCLVRILSDQRASSL